MIDLDGVLGRRLAAQHLIGAPHASVADAVRSSLGVQCQDMPLARFSLGRRTGLTDAAVQAQLATGEVVRTHVLRATWHWVAAADVRWLLALTAPKVESGFGARHRSLGITDAFRDAAFAVLERELAGGVHLTRKELQPLLPVAGLALASQVTGHLLQLAELRGLVVSGAPRSGGEHTYALMDEVVPAAAPLDREEAVARLVDGFVAGHGPTAVKDVQRWATLTKTEITRALAAGEASGAYEAGEVDGVRLWWRAGAADHGTDGAWLLPTFDEAFLSHDRPRFPRPAGHPLGEQHLNAAEAGAGVIVVDGRDVGQFRRRLDRGRLRVRVEPAEGATEAERAASARAALQLGEHLGLEPEVEVHSARP